MASGLSNLEEHGLMSDELSSGVRGLLHVKSQEDFDSILDELMKMFHGKESILDSLRKISISKDNLARYILNDIKGSCGKVSINTCQPEPCQCHLLMLAESYKKIQNSKSKICLVDRECWRKKG